MSNLPVSSRIKAPTSTSRSLKPPGATKPEGVVAPRSASGIKPPALSSETPQKSGLKQPLMKRSSAGGETEKTAKRTSVSASGSGLTTPRSKPSTGSQTKLNKIGLARPQSTPVAKREGLTTNLKSQLSESNSSLNKEHERPGLTREKTQESLKDVETGILFKVGDRVLVGGSKAGVIEYLGETKFAKGDWAGIKLDEPSGKNDGCVAGVRYFDCEPLHGVFSKSNRLHKINIVPNKKNSISEFKLEESNVLKIGDLVLVSGTKLGTLRYLGPTEFAKGEWAGVELEEALGKNDGAVAGTRYFSCEMKYGLFAPASKIVKSKKQTSKKLVSLTPETSLASIAKSAFIRTTSLSSDISETHDAVSVPSEKPSLSSVNVSTSSPIESLHQTLKKTPSNSQQVAALQSALEEREREIRKLLMERELEKAEKLKGLDEMSDDSVSYKQVVKEKDDTIQSLKNDLEKSKKEISITQTKLDEEKKKYEDLQFMLEEEMITDDELKNHVKEDEFKIKELSDETTEKNQKIISLKKELQGSRMNNLDNETKIIELRDELNQSKTKIAHLESNAATSRDTTQQNTEQLETLLGITQKELNESREEVRRKSQQINKLENTVDTQMKQQKEVEDVGKWEMEEKLATAEVEKRNVAEECEIIKSQKEQVVGELAQLQNEKNEMLLHHTSTTEKLQVLEKQYKDLTDAHTMLTTEKDQDIKANNLNLNAKILHLENELTQSHAKISHLENNMATSSDDSQQRTQENVNLNAKILHLENELTQSHSKISHLENNMATSADDSQQRTQELQILLANANRELGEHKEEVNKKTVLVDEMESKLNAQIARQKEVEKEVESLDQADKNLALVKEAHRTEVGTLQSKVNSMAETIAEMEKKQGDILQKHNSELDVYQASKDEEIENLREKIRIVETEKSNSHNECGSLRVEKENVFEELSRLKADYNDAHLSNSATSERLLEFEKKCNDLSEANTQLSSERNDVIQLCEEQDQQLNVLKKEKDSATLQKDLLAKEKDQLCEKVVSLEAKINNLHSESAMKQGEFQEVKESEIRSLEAQLEKVSKEKQTANNLVETLKQEKKTFECNRERKEDEVIRLQNEQLKMHSQSQELQNEISDLKKKMLEDADSSRQKIETLSDEIAILKDDLDEGKVLLKQKNEDIQTYKEQIDKMRSEGIPPKSPMDGDILENASTLLIRLHESESKLSILQTEKETAEEQMEFLNSVIVDLQSKNEKANQTIALLEAGDELILLDSESDDEAILKPKYNIRKFCDICDVFDNHETDECPLQESGGDTGGVKNFGDRDHERPYCNICEAFGHWTEDCDDEETF